LKKESVKSILWGIKEKEKKYKTLCEKIEVLQTRAEKITPNYVKSEGSCGFNSESKVEQNCVEIVEYERQAQKLKAQIDFANGLLKHIKSYQRYLVKKAYIFHIPIKRIAIEEHTSEQNIRNIINRALNQIALKA
jgi:hypothetical protein